jgi:hypothetical protein
LIKGFVLNDERLKETGHTNKYFDELLERIREFRSSEKIFYAKIKDMNTKNDKSRASTTIGKRGEWLHSSSNLFQLRDTNELRNPRLPILANR